MAKASTWLLLPRNAPRYGGGDTKPSKSKLEVFYMDLTPDNERRSGYIPNSQQAEAEIYVAANDPLTFLACVYWWEILQSNQNTEVQEMVNKFPFLTDVKRVFLATTSRNKFDTFVELFHQHLNLVVGDQPIPIHSAICPGDEPPDQQALLVAKDKIMRSLSWLLGPESRIKEIQKGKRKKEKGTSKKKDAKLIEQRISREGGKAVGFAFDTTVSVGPQDSDTLPVHLLNMSRYKNVEGNIINVPERTKTLQQLYSQGPTIVQYDVAAVGSVQNNKKQDILVGTGMRISLYLDKIPPEDIEKVFTNNVAVSLGSNVGIPLVDEKSYLLQYIQKIEICPLSHFLAKKSNGDPRGTILDYSSAPHTNKPLVLNLSNISSDEVRSQIFTSLNKWIIGGVPPNFKSILKVDPNSSELADLQEGEVWIV